jgi:hypothetical protein
MGAFFRGILSSRPKIFHMRTLDTGMTEKKEVIPYRKFILFYELYKTSG